MAARKCKYGRRQDGKCRKRPKSRKTSTKRKCKLVRVPGRRQLLCKVGKRWKFTKNRRAA